MSGGLFGRGFWLGLFSFLLCSASLSVWAQSEAGNSSGVADAGKTKSRKAKDEVEIDHFMRVRKNNAGKPEALETSVTRYETVNAAGEPVIVDLIGVVHIGEKEYYQELNKHFEKYDALLYELVAPEGTTSVKLL